MFQECSYSVFSLLISIIVYRQDPHTSGTIDVAAAMRRHAQQTTLTFPTFSLPQITWNYRPALRFLGTSMVIGSLVILLLVTSPLLALELRAVVYRMTAPYISFAQRANLIEPQPTPTSAPTPPPEEQRFHIRIPAIGVDSDVIPNIDAGNPKEYIEALKKGVAHARGTGFPGQDGGINKNIFIFGHSTNGDWNITRYNALFYNLKDLNPGDEIQVWFWGKEYWYKVVERKIVSADDTSFLAPQQERERLILQTCFPPGTIWKRLIVVAEPK